MQGQWDRHPKHDSQFKAEVCEQTLPATIASIQGYPGQGNRPKTGGADRVGRITKAWQEQKQVKEIMVFLQGHGVSTNLTTKIYKNYGDKSLETARQNPYQLERDKEKE